MDKFCGAIHGAKREIDHCDLANLYSSVGFFASFHAEACRASIVVKIFIQFVFVCSRPVFSTKALNIQQRCLDKRTGDFSVFSVDPARNQILGSVLFWHIDYIKYVIAVALRNFNGGKISNFRLFQDGPIGVVVIQFDALAFHAIVVA